MTCGSRSPFSSRSFSPSAARRGGVPLVGTVGVDDPAVAPPPSCPAVRTIVVRRCHFDVLPDGVIQRLVGRVGRAPVDHPLRQRVYPPLGLPLVCVLRNHPLHQYHARIEGGSCPRRCRWRRRRGGGGFRRNDSHRRRRRTIAVIVFEAFRG